MHIRYDYVHHVSVASTRRLYQGGEETTHSLWKGTSEQIAQQVATAVKSQLDHGYTARIELTPLAPNDIIDLGTDR